MPAQERPKQEEIKDNGQVVRRSWRPASRIEVPAKLRNPRFEYYWASSGIPGNMQKKLMEGWEIDKEIAPKMRELGLLPPTLEDGKFKDDVFRMREMILLRMPVELLQERREYYREKSSLQKAVKKANEEMKGEIESQKGASTYGKITIE